MYTLRRVDDAYYRRVSLFVHPPPPLSQFSLRLLNFIAVRHFVPLAMTMTMTMFYQALNIAQHLSPAKCLSALEMTLRTQEFRLGLQKSLITIVSVIFGFRYDSFQGLYKCYQYYYRLSIQYRNIYSTAFQVLIAKFYILRYILNTVRLTKVSSH